MSGETNNDGEQRIPVMLTRDEANALAEALTLFVEALMSEEYAEQGGDWLLEIRDRILSSEGVH